MHQLVNIPLVQTEHYLGKEVDTSVIVNLMHEIILSTWLSQSNICLESCNYQKRTCSWKLMREKLKQGNINIC